MLYSLKQQPQRNNISTIEAVDLQSRADHSHHDVAPLACVWLCDVHVKAWLQDLQNEIICCLAVSSILLAMLAPPMIQYQLSELDKGR